MPTIFRSAGYRFYFYSHEPREPPHVRIDGAGATMKVWLEEPEVAKSRGFRAKEQCYSGAGRGASRDDAGGMA